jgi:hypothetical protein
MREATNKQKPSSKEGGEMKIGDKVWVLCHLREVLPDRTCKVEGSQGASFWTAIDACRPVEPEPAKEPTRGQKLAERTMKAIWAANHAVNETPVVKESLATEPNPSEIPNSSSDPLLLGDAVELQSNNVWRGTKGILTNWCPIKKAFWFESLDPSRKAISGWMKEQWDDEETGICRLVKIDHPNDSPKTDGSIDPLAVGDAVRFVSPGHKRHGTEGILKSIHHGPKNAYLFVSDCGQFHRYCTIAELEHYDKAGTVDVKGSMASLDGADTIQEGDLQWTDRDGKYRLCNFTIGMRVHEAIQRGKAHGEKWVFYRKFKEVGE